MPNNFNFTGPIYVPSNYDFDFSGDHFVYNILSNVGDNFIAIWADQTANIDTAKVYVSTAGTDAAFFIIDLEKKMVYDTYTVNKKGAFGEKLDQENVVDINISKAV